MTKQQWLNTIYPIGSIYTSVNSTSPETLFGGTWEALGGRFLIGANEDYMANSTGGSTEHTHDIAHTHTVEHSHTMAHTHTVAHSHTMAHTHTLSHTHTMAHTHSVTAKGTNAGTAITKAQLPSYVLGDIPGVVPANHGNWNNNHVAASNLGATSSSKPGVNQISGNAITSGTQWSYRVNSGGSGSAHTHTFTGSAVTSGGSSAANTGGASATTTSGVSTPNTGESTPTTSASSNANTGTSTPTTSAASNETSGSTSTLPPYLVVYMWKRTA